MKRLIFGFIVAMLLFSIIGCTKTVEVFVCANGLKVSDASKCPTNKVAGVKKQEAEQYSRNYVNAYFTAKGGRAQLISSYLDADKGDYFATFVVSPREGEPYETIVSIDGKTGQVNCTSECGYTGS